MFSIDQAKADAILQAAARGELHKLEDAMDHQDNLRFCGVDYDAQEALLRRDGQIPAEV